MIRWLAMMEWVWERVWKQEAIFAESVESILREHQEISSVCWKSTKSSLALSQQRGGRENGLRFLQTPPGAFFQHRSYCLWRRQQENVGKKKSTLPLHLHCNALIFENGKKIAYGTKKIVVKFQSINIKDLHGNQRRSKVLKYMSHNNHEI